MINLRLNIIEKRRMEGWPWQADRNRSDHLIFDVANDKQDPVPGRATCIPGRVGHLSQLEPLPGPSELGWAGPRGFLWCWELIHVAQVSPRARTSPPLISALRAARAQLGSAWHFTLSRLFLL